QGHRRRSAGKPCRARGAGRCLHRWRHGHTRCLRDELGGAQTARAHGGECGDARGRAASRGPSGEAWRRLGAPRCQLFGAHWSAESAEAAHGGAAMAGGQAMSGTFYGVGVGPGDPELLTLKAWRLISQVPVIAYPAANGNDSLARSIAAPFIPEDAIELAIAVPMRPERQ